MEKKFDNFKTEDPTATVSSAALPKEIIPDSTKCKVSGWYPTGKDFLSFDMQFELFNH